MQSERSILRKGAFFIALSTLLLCSSCFSNKSLRLSDQELYQLGTQQFEHKKYLKSRETYTLLLDYYPDSSYAAEAQLSKADAYFNEKSYIEAGIEYNLFLEFHPAHPRADYALFQEAECNYINIRSIDRDQTNVIETIKKLKKLQSLYPQSTYRDQAQERIEECQSLINNHSLYVARFYYRWARFVSSIERYNSLLSTEPAIDDELLKTVQDELEQVKQEYLTFLIGLSDKNFLKGRYHGTLSAYEKMLEYFPEKENDETVLFRMALSYESTEDYDNASTYFQKVIDHFPSGEHAAEAQEHLSQIKAKREAVPAT
ncbi:outer membrane protein assembly factor BamD [bacterium]|nr:outer membrane protein assembly factor BamD [bacterium]